MRNGNVRHRRLESVLASLCLHVFRSSLEFGEMQKRVRDDEMHEETLIESSHLNFK